MNSCSPREDLSPLPYNKAAYSKINVFAHTWGMTKTMWAVSFRRYKLRGNIMAHSFQSKAIKGVGHSFLPCDCESFTRWHYGLGRSESPGRSGSIRIDLKEGCD